MKLHQQLDQSAAALWAEPRSQVRERLVAHYLPFAEQLAMGMVRKNPKVEFDDAYQEACIGLMEAIDRFDPGNERGATFTTYASWRLHGAMVEAERNNDWVPAKVRAADKVAEQQGAETLPKMRHWLNDTEFKHPQLLREFVESETDIAAILVQMTPVSRRYLEWLLDTDWDIDGIAKREGCGVNQIGLCVRWGIEKATSAKVAA